MLPLDIRGLGFRVCGLGFEQGVGGGGGGSYEGPCMVAATAPRLNKVCTKGYLHNEFKRSRDRRFAVYGLGFRVQGLEFSVWA